MTHRLLAVIAVACLLGACSGGEGTVDGERPGETQAAASAEASVPDTAGARESSPDSVSDQSPDALPGPDVVYIPDESPEPSTEPEAPADDESTQPAAPEFVASTSGLRVIRSYVCKGIEQGEPTEAGKSFVPEDGVLRLCCFSEIAGAAGPDTVFHVWRWGDREMARVALEVKSARWRTWSTKRILDEWRGEWHIDIADREGGVLTRLEFSVE